MTRHSTATLMGKWKTGDHSVRRKIRNFWSLPEPFRFKFDMCPSPGRYIVFPLKQRFSTCGTQRSCKWYAKREEGEKHSTFCVQMRVLTFAAFIQMISDRHRGFALAAMFIRITNGMLERAFSISDARIAKLFTWRRNKNVVGKNELRTDMAWANITI